RTEVNPQKMRDRLPTAESRSTVRDRHMQYKRHASRPTASQNASKADWVLGLPLAQMTTWRSPSSLDRAIAVYPSENPMCPQAGPHGDRCLPISAVISPIPSP